MDSIETFERLKYMGITPIQLKKSIVSYLDQHNHYHNEWKDVENDGSLCSLQVLNTEFFKIYVHYDETYDSTVMHMQVKNPKHLEKIREGYHFPSKNLYVMYCDNTTLQEFLEEFAWMYDESYQTCKKCSEIDYKKNYTELSDINIVVT